MEANILVVEDEKGIRDAITIYLKNQGYHVYEAENGAQGLEMVENHTIHLAIVDIMMPVMDGITMTMKLREKYEAAMKDLKLSTAIKLALGDSAQDADLVAGLFDKSKLIMSDDGKITGLDEQMKALKKEKAFLFKEEKTPQQQIKGGKPAEGKGTPPADKKPSEMTYSEMCAYLEANPGATIE